MTSAVPPARAEKQKSMKGNQENPRVVIRTHHKAAPDLLWQIIKASLDMVHLTWNNFPVSQNKTQLSEEYNKIQEAIM